MKTTRRLKSAFNFVILAAAFASSVYIVSDLMPRLLHAVVRGISLTDGLWIIGYLAVGTISVGYLARAIYRVDRRAGRIRNRVPWFEQRD